MGGELSGFLGWDRAMFVAINKTLANGFLDALMPLFSDFSIWLIPLCIVWLYFFIRTNRNGRLVAIGCFLVMVCTDQVSDAILKPAVARQRPCNVLPSVHYYDENGNWLTTDKFALTTYKPSFSFPSSHAANIAGQATYWSYFYPHLSPVMIFVAVGVGYSRVYLGHHYPGDVAVGYLLGVAFALVVGWMLRRWVIPTSSNH